MKKNILFLIIVILTGCTYYEDINNLAIIEEIAIDYDNSYKLYTKVLSNNKEKEDKIYLEECNKLNECFNNLNNKLTKKLYLTHLDLLILSNNLKKDNYNEIMNYFLRESSSRNTFTTIITNKIDDNLLKMNAIDYQNLLDLSKKTIGIADNITFNDLVKNILNYKISYIPVIENNEIKGYKTIYDEEKILSKDESIIVNFILNKIDDVTLLINEENKKLESCETLYKNKDNKLILSITCNHQGKEKEDIINYLNNNINNFIKNNSLDYFYYLKEKYGIKGKLEIINDINIILTEMDSGDYFE